MKTYFSAILLVIAIMGTISGCKKDDPDPGPVGGNGGASLAITNISPSAGAEGTKVVITGAGFSATASKNVVKFGEVVAKVDSVSATRIVTQVPSGAKTGKISVEVNGKSSVGTTDFMVSANPPVFGSGQTANTVAGLTPTGGTVSSTISAKGGGTVTQHGHVWSKTNNPPTLADGKSELGKLPDAATFPYKVTTDLKNLEANTTYYVRAYVTSDNVTLYGEVFEVKTVQIAEVKVTFDTQQQDITGLTGSSFTIKSFLFAPANTEISQCGHVWSLNTSPTIADSKTELGKATAQSTFITLSSTVTGLSGKTKYYVRPYAIVNNQIHYGGTWTVTTPEQFNNTIVPVKKADFPGKVESNRNVSFVKEGKLFVMDGNYTQTGYQYNYKFWQYDPAANTWSEGFDLNGVNTMSKSGVSAYFDKKWYYLDSDANLTEYDFTAGKASTSKLSAAGFSSGYGDILHDVENGKVYIARQKDLWTLDLAAKTLVKTGTIPIQRDVLSLAVLSGRVYVMGDGRVDITEDSKNALFEYNIASKAWTEKAIANAGNALKLRTYHFRYIKAIKGKLYGFNRWGIGEYDPGSNTWSKAYVSVAGEDVLEGNVKQVIGSKAYIGIYNNHKYLYEIAP